MLERRFWRFTARSIAVLLVGLLLGDASGALPVPPAATAFLVSCLVCIAVGWTVVSTRSSPARLDAAAERAVRRRQVAVGMAISLAVALALLVPEVRRGPVAWFLAPMVALGPVLAVRESWARR